MEYITLLPVTIMLFMFRYQFDFMTNSYKLDIYWLQFIHERSRRSTRLFSLGVHSKPLPWSIYSSLWLSLIKSKSCCTILFSFSTSSIAVAIKVWYETNKKGLPLPNTTPNVGSSSQLREAWFIGQTYAITHLTIRYSNKKNVSR